MDRLEAMQLFVRVAELGSFSAAARQKNIARSAVTRLVAALENHLGTRLIARSTRRLALTSAGVAYLAKCREILNLVEGAESDAAEDRRMPRGAIRISVPLSYGLKRLAPVLLEFTQQYPDVALEMDFSDLISAHYQVINGPTADREYARIQGIPFFGLFMDEYQKNALPARTEKPWALPAQRL